MRHLMKLHCMLQIVAVFREEPPSYWRQLANCCLLSLIFMTAGSRESLDVLIHFCHIFYYPCICSPSLSTHDDEDHSRRLCTCSVGRIASLSAPVIATIHPQSKNTNRWFLSLNAATGESVLIKYASCGVGVSPRIQKRRGRRRG